MLRRSGSTMLITGLVAMLAAGFAGCRPVDLLNALTPRTARREADQAYGPDARQRLDVYLPASPATTQPRAMVVFFYGGSWQSGERRDYRFVGEALASRGYVVVVPDYRVYPQTRFPGFIDDAAAAVRWAQTHASAYGADPHRLFLMGHSAGAQIVALLATDDRYLEARQTSKRAIAGVIGLAGPYDFLPLTDPVLQQVFPPASREASQPIDFVHGDEPPMLLAASRDDRTVDPGNTARFAARLTAAGDVVTVQWYRGIGHAMTVGALGAPLRQAAPVLDDVSRFIDAH